MAEKIEYDIKREWVADATPKELGEYATYVREQVLPAGYRLTHIVPMVSKGPGLVSFLEIYIKG